MGRKRVDEPKRQGGTSRAYIVRRLERDRPDLAARLAQGEFRSARAAAREAGWVVEKAPATPFERLVKAWERVTLEEQMSLLCQALDCSPAELAEFVDRKEKTPTARMSRSREQKLAEREAVRSKRLAKTMWESLPRKSE